MALEVYFMAVTKSLYGIMNGAEVSAFVIENKNGYVKKEIRNV